MTLQSDIDTFFKLLRSPIHCSWSAEIVLQFSKNRTYSRQKFVRKRLKTKCPIEFLQFVFESSNRRHNLLADALRCLKKTKQDLEFFQKPLLPYRGHVVYGSPDKKLPNILYLCDPKSIIDISNWNQVVYNNFALKVEMKKLGYLQDVDNFKVVLASVNVDGKIISVSKGDCEDVQNQIAFTQHFHRNKFTISSNRVCCDDISLYRKCDQCVKYFISVSKNILNSCSSLLIRCTSTNESDSLWHSLTFVRHRYKNILHRPLLSWDEKKTQTWKKTMRKLVIKICQVVLLNSQILEYNYTFLPDRVSAIDKNIDSDSIRIFINKNTKKYHDCRKSLDLLFELFISICEEESDENLSRSTTPTESPPNSPRRKIFNFRSSPLAKLKASPLKKIDTSPTFS